MSNRTLLTGSLAACAALGFITAAAIAGSCSSCGTHEKTASYAKSYGKNIVETAQGAGSFNTLLAAAKAAGLAETLATADKLTVFAPTDAAFAKLPKGTVESLLKPENRDRLKAILLYHVAPGKVKAAKVVKAKQLETVFGQSASIAMRDGGAYIDNAKILKTDVMASNGVIHVIDSVIIPKDIVEVAQSTGKFKTLTAAATAAGLVDTLKTKDLTVFAPTDEAFAALPAGTVESLLKPENLGQLRSILTYHVAPGRIGAAEVMKTKQITTAQGQPLAVHVKKVKNDKGEYQKVVQIDNARVVMTDIPALNGVIHVIDAVVLPSAAESRAPASDDSLSRAE